MMLTLQLKVKYALTCKLWPILWIMPLYSPQNEAKTSQI